MQSIARTRRTAVIQVQAYIQTNIRQPQFEVIPSQGIDDLHRRSERGIMGDDRPTDQA
jgi:hypothetical protein